MKRHLVDTPEGQLHLRSAGPPDAGRAVLFFHQSPSSSRMWSTVMADLEGRGVASLAGDMFNYGMSDRRSAPLGLDRHADLLFGAARSLTSARFTAVGHHTGAVFAASCAARHPLDGLVVIGYPLYGSERHKRERLGARMRPDHFSAGGSELAELWKGVNRSLEKETDHAVRHAILVDRLSAGPAWYHAYAALLSSDLEETLTAASRSGVPVRTVFAVDDALSRLAPGVAALTGSEPVWIEGGPWVTVEHPARVTDLVFSAYMDWA